MTDPYAVLGRELVQAARRLDAAVGPAGRLRAWASRHLRAIALAAAGLLSGGAVAIAATGVLSGTPVAPEKPPRPAFGNGVPVRGSDTRILATVADPAGGLPWGLRVFHTTRGQVCVEVGRVQDGQLGEIGEDSIFAGDGRFHALPPDALPPGYGGSSANVECVSAGRTVISEDANADRNAARLLPEEFEPAGRRRVPPVSHRRALAYGVLGPHAVSVTYRTPHGARTVPVHGRDGAFLIVQMAGFYKNSSLVGGSIGGRAERRNVRVLGPQTGTMVSGATFRFGTARCSEGTAAPVTGRCPQRPVFFSKYWGEPTRSLHRPVRLRFVRQSPATCKRAFLRTPCYGGVVSFTAPYAITQAGADYLIAGRDVPRCPVGGRPETGWSLERNVKRGEQVRSVSRGLWVYTPKCAAHEFFTVSYLNPEGPSPSAPHTSVIVGTVAFSEATLPGGAAKR